MATYELSENLFLSVTPAGAYHSVSSAVLDEMRKMLRWILKQSETPALNLDTLRAWEPENISDDDLMEFLFKAQRLGYVEGLSEPEIVSDETVEDILPTLLEKLSNDGNVLLSDSEGFTISSAGFDAEIAEQLSALSADLASLHDRHAQLLKIEMGLGFNAWGIIDAAGNSQVGFWPIFIREHRFVLVVGGLPQLNQANLTTLIQVLSNRYG